ncbi:MAG: 6-pyruvoyl trahydropterin synthase family protein [Thermoguttaceae bacterium]
MFQVTREIDFCYGHRLLDYDGKCKHLHGHNGKVLITMEARSLNGLGMVLDFAEIKRVIQRWIDEKLDHRMILRRDDPVVGMLLEMNEPLMLIDDNPTAENIAKLIAEYGLEQGFPVVEVRIWETPNCSAVYQVPRETREGEGRQAGDS